MSTPRDPLEEFAVALRLQVHERLQSEPPTPDVADVVDRALALDADAVPPGLRDSLPSDASDTIEEDALDLAPFAAALRATVEEAAQDRSMAAIPAPPARRHTVRWVAAAALALAAALVLIVRASFTGQTSERLQTATPWMGAEKSYQQDGPLHELRERRPKLKPDRLGAIELDPDTETPETSETPAPPTDTGTAKRRKTSQADALDDLEARAREHWKAGRLSEAERMFRVIIARGGHDRRELAYGDLFSLERQRGGAAAQSKIWREYLGKFPAGRFAEDARAGLCGREHGDAQLQCWRQYLQHHPDGAHSARARATLGDMP